MIPNDPDVAREALVEALDRLLVALVALGGLEPGDSPLDALDVALRADDTYTEARAGFHDVLHEVRDALGKEHLRLYLTAEAAGNALSAATADVAFRLGASARRR